MDITLALIFVQSTDDKINIDSGREIFTLTYGILFLKKFCFTYLGAVIKW